MSAAVICHYCANQLLPDMFYSRISLIHSAALFYYSLLVIDMIYNFSNNTCKFRTMQLEWLSVFTGLNRYKPV